jgi:hypothetical protein
VFSIRKFAISTTVSVFLSFDNSFNPSIAPLAITFRNDLDVFTISFSCDIVFSLSALSREEEIASLMLFPIAVATFARTK